VQASKQARKESPAPIPSLILVVGWVRSRNPILENHNTRSYRTRIPNSSLGFPGFVYLNGGDAGQVSVVVSGGGYSGMDPFQVRFCLSILFFPFPFGNAFSLLELRVYCSWFLSGGFLGPGFRLVKEGWIGWVPVDLSLSPSVS
jgi:hypothetical protein